MSIQMASMNMCIRFSHTSDKEHIKAKALPTKTVSTCWYNSKIHFCSLPRMIPSLDWLIFIQHFSDKTTIVSSCLFFPLKTVFDQEELTVFWPQSLKNWDHRGMPPCTLSNFEINGNYFSCYVHKKHCLKDVIYTSRA